MKLKTKLTKTERARLQRQEKIALLFQVTGMSDIMRGQASQKATATEQRIKAGFASTRVQTMLAKALGGARGIRPFDVDLCRALLMFTSYHQKVECLRALEKLEGKP